MLTLKKNPITLTSLAYHEFQGLPQTWQLKRAQIGSINLLVGKNASGKSRFITLITSLAKLITGELPNLFSSGTYSFEFSVATGHLVYEVEMNNSLVVRERFSVNDEDLMLREADGSGEIWATQLNDKIRFQSPPEQLAVKVRRDKVQHPYLEDLHQWASSVRTYFFGTTLGRTHVFTLADLMRPEPPKESVEVETVTQLYTRGFQTFGKAFDQAILRDLRHVGYPCTDVRADSEQVPGFASPMVILKVREVGLTSLTPQILMSQGMFRALAMVIHLNYIFFVGEPRMVLIDDVGEGLDFDRSTKFIDLLIRQSQKNTIQLIMTTNDRFVMNKVALSFWHIVTRSKSVVKLINYANAPEVFSSFENIGLSNFDLFARDLFKTI